jgi:cereblon
MSDEGAGGAYCNPAGLVHDVLTVGEVFPNAVALEGDPSSEFSWFPGFAWTVAVCVRCRQHLGWQFTPEEATTTRTGSGVPRSRFFGLTRARVRADGFESLESLCDIADTPYAQQVRSLEAADEWDA